MILDERGFDAFMPWAQRAREFLNAYGNPPSPTTEEDWQFWGARLGDLPGLAGQLIPSPYTYQEWRQWVQDLNQSVNPSTLIPWSAIPNFAKNGAFSVNIFTTYYALPSTGVTLTVVGSLPTGWTFVSPNLAHAGAVLSGPNSISFTASYSNGLRYPSNTFTVQGI